MAKPSVDNFEVSIMNLNANLIHPDAQVSHFTSVSRSIALLTLISLKLNLGGRKVCQRKEGLRGRHFAKIPSYRLEFAQNIDNALILSFVLPPPRRCVIPPYLHRKGPYRQTAILSQFVVFLSILSISLRKHKKIIL